MEPHMPQDVLAVVQLQRTTGVPADVVENTFPFVALTGSPVDLASASTALVDFYKNTAGHHVLEYYLSDNIAKTGVHHIKWYDLTPLLAGPGHTMGPPIDDVTFSLAGSTSLGGDLPDEVAACISYHADFTGVPEHGVGTRPRARYRGRLFIGPLQGGADAITIDSGFAHLKPNFRDDLALYASTLISHAALGNAAWAVWSRKDLLLRPVTGGFVDNQFDSQRRRRPGATARTNYT
jgi:hypothetical protein